ncbi:MAG: lipoate--protein ligase [Bacteroidales bacterium]|nr:lipoate--protein ligase [Bacteroidales bacterium]
MLQIMHQRDHNPYFNIATEELLLKHKTDDFFLVYRNNPSLIIGKHQNANAEINHQFVERNGIPVVRRLSGGGTVYHDLGNINFCFIMTGAEGRLVDFKRYTEPLIDILHGFGVDAYLGDKSDIRVGDYKISGNAEHIFRNRVLHHGTILYSTNLHDLNEAIHVDAAKFTDSAVKSNRSQVANVSDFIPGNLTIESFERVMVDYMKRSFPNTYDFFLSQADVEAVNSLIRTRYSTWDWIYGYSPTYEVRNSAIIGECVFPITVKVVRGYIDDVLVEGETPSLVAALNEALVGVRHDRSSIAAAFDEKQIGDLQSNRLFKYLAEHFC